MALYSLAVILSRRVIIVTNEMAANTNKSTTMFNIWEQAMCVEGFLQTHTCPDVGKTKDNSSDHMNFLHCSEVLRFVLITPGYVLRISFGYNNNR